MECLFMINAERQFPVSYFQRIYLKDMIFFNILYFFVTNYNLMICSPTYAPSVAKNADDSI
jgi:hypothetical protein